MIRPAPPAAIVLAAALLPLSAARVLAEPINLLQPGGRTSSRVLFDPAKPPWGSDEEAAAQVDDDCVAVADASARDHARLGGVTWTHGRLSWEWNARREPAMVYLICVDDPRTPSSAGGGLGVGFAAALSWANASTARLTAMADVATAPPQPTAFEVGPTPFIDIESHPVLLDMPLTTSLLLGNASTNVADQQIAGTDPPLNISAPSLLNDPIDFAPVPEPATWILIGTGLGIAWRTRIKNL